MPIQLAVVAIALWKNRPTKRGAINYLSVATLVAAIPSLSRP